MTQSWRPDEWADDGAWRGDLHCDAEPWRAGSSDERWRGQEHIADWPEAQAGPLVHPVLGAGLRVRPVGDMLLAAPALVARTGAPRLGVAMEIAAPRVVVSPFVRSPRLCHTSLLVGRAVRP